jgi:hypothetical protein
MNKVLIATVLACGLLLLESPEAAAHEGKGSHSRQVDRDRSDTHRRDAHSRDFYSRNAYRSERYETQHKRAKKMPRWLKHDRSFGRWFEHTRFQRNRHFTWNELFDIYRWERSYFTNRRH